MTATQPLEASDISTAELMRLGDGGRPSDDAGKPAHARVTEACRRWPTKIAVASGAERLTYGELDAQANRLATELRARGVGPEAIVGVCLPRRASIAVAVLAVMRAGGAYLPLDPGYPTDRRRFMLEDAGASVLITTPEVGSDLSGGQIPTLDPRTASVDGGATDRRPERSSKPSDLAYVMYTSGSTGRPKGVMVEHRGLAGLVDWALCTFSREELSSVLAST